MSKLSWLGLGLCCLAIQVFAETPANLVQKKLSSIQTMKAHFTQTVRAKQGVMTRSSGVMAFAKPDRFRWQTKQPMAQVVVADGKKVWVYDVELEQVTVSLQTKNLGAVGVLFLSQDTNAVEKNFTVTLQVHHGKEVFDLHAKLTQSNFERVQLTFEKNKLTTIVLDDQLGQHTSIQLSQIVMNHPQPERLFQFHVPSSVDVVYQ